MSKQKIIFMGTPNIAAQHLEILIKNDMNIIGVFTQPPSRKSRGMHLEESEVHQVAKKYNIEIFTPRLINQTIIDKTKNLNPDLIIVVAYGLILPIEFLNIPTLGCINLHFSLLPRWRGASPIEHALLLGDNETGVSIIKMSSKLDAGDIYQQEKIFINDEMYSDDLTEVLITLGKKNIIKILPDLFKNKIVPIKQDETKISYAKKFSTLNRKINFNNSVDEVYNHIRAHGPNPGSWFTYKGERIKILKAKKINIIGKQSTILNKDFALACNNGSILPISIKREGKKTLNLKDFIRGFDFSVSDKINA